MQRLIIRLGVVVVLAFAAVVAQAQTCTDAQITSPTNGATLTPNAAGQVTFSWCNANADYFLVLESVPGAHDIFYAIVTVTSVSLGPSCSPTPPIQCIPMNGEPIYAHLQTQVKGVWNVGFDTKYTAGTTAGVGTAVWNGGAGLWSNSANWSGGMPNGNFNVFIDKGKTTVASAVTLDMNAAIDSLTVDVGDSLALRDTTDLTVSGTSISNAGSIAFNSAGNPTGISIAPGHNVGLTGGGKLTLSETTDYEMSFISGGTGSILTNVDNTIQGTGQIGQLGGLQLVNQSKGIISANQKFPLTVNAAGGVSNAGLMRAVSGHTLGISSPLTNTGTIQTTGAASNVQITQSFSNSGRLMPGAGGLINLTGPFSNFSSTTSTLTGGTYAVTGTLQFLNANVVTNAAHVSLTGAASKIIDQLSNNGLRNLAKNTSLGSLALQSGRTLTVPGAFSNAGMVTVGVGSGFGSASSYTQTAGKTTVDGALSAPGGMNIQKGLLFGKGTINSTVVSSGSVTAGDTALSPGKLSIAGTYTQSALGVLNISIGALATGQLAVTNGVSLNGKLNLKLVNGFVPAIGSSFTILTGSAVSGTFPTVTGLSINAGEHFQIKYNPTSVIVTVISGP
jgi:hypothetical protein